MREGDLEDMITVRKSEERGHFDHGWLETYHTFSFADYYDPDYTGYRTLRVLNEDRVKPGHGFPTHGHRDMEIITYVLEGALEHKDSLGTGSIIRPGDVQRMSAGTGVMHSEFNPSKDELVHFLQIWILPSRKAIQPSYEQKSFSTADRENLLRLIASPDGAEGSVKIHTDTELRAAFIEKGREVRAELRAGRHGWVQVARGAVSLNGETLAQGDGAAVQQETALRLTAQEDAEVLVFDLP